MTAKSYKQSKNHLDTDSPLSASQRYAAARARTHIYSARLENFIYNLDFFPDDFQLQALQAVDKGQDVLVAAPTGAGKTLIGQWAAQLAIHKNGKCFYTTPIKALSNQKYQEFISIFPADKVGILTGDISINSQAEILVMTTEVLRNMIYAQSSTLENITHVVIDEVHYLGDKFRGPTWEEIILQLPSAVSFISLSATISKPEELQQWISVVRGETVIITSEKRPVPITVQMLVDSTLYNIFAKGKEFQGAAGLNPQLNARVKQKINTLHRHRFWRGSSRYTVIEALKKANQLPAIFFIFSRQGCDQAVENLLATSIQITTKAEKNRIIEIAQQAISGVGVSDLEVIGADSWIESLARGIAAHHAGLLPIMKETVEQLFIAGLIKLVFATETIALGINMPARSVVIDQLTKWDGDSHVYLTPGQFTQLIGRAGRRGIDTHGFAVTVANSEVLPAHVAALVTKKHFPLNSAFLPTYSMAVGLIKLKKISLVREILLRSFAQFQANKQVVKLAQKQCSLQGQLDKFESLVSCELGEVKEFFILTQEISQIEKQHSIFTRQRAKAMQQSLFNQLRAGDLVQWQWGKKQFTGVALEIIFAGNNPKAKILTAQGKYIFISSGDVNMQLEILGHIRLPAKRARAEKTEFIDKIIQAIRSAKGNKRKNKSAHTANFITKTPVFADCERLNQLRTLISAHPCKKCPDLYKHLEILREEKRVQIQISQVTAQISKNNNGLLEHFDNLCSLLNQLGYIYKYGDTWRISELGDKLATVHCEKSLLTTQCLQLPSWRAINAAEFAAVIAALVYTPRSDQWLGSAPPNNPKIIDALNDADKVYNQLVALEKKYQISPTDPPIAQVVAGVYAWARGESIATLMLLCDLSAGDAVRFLKQVIDLLDHIEQIDDPLMVTTAHNARKLIKRGVVLWNNL